MQTAPPSSQPAPPQTDPLGSRHRRTAGDCVEDVLEVRHDLAAAGFFEFPLRERVLRLAGFRHPSFVRVHRVERAPGRQGALAIASDAADGVLLGDVLAAAAERGAAVPARWALDIVRQLVDGTSALHGVAGDVSHGALTPARILIGSDGGVMILDYVFGAALEQLGYSSDQCWTELGVPTNPEAPEIDQRLDLFQIGLLGLQLLGESVSLSTLARTGRQRAVSALSASGETGPLVADARRWLARALQLDAPFTSALDARNDLASMLARYPSPSALAAGPPAWLPAAGAPDGVIPDTTSVAPAADLPRPRSSFTIVATASTKATEAGARIATIDFNRGGSGQRYEMLAPAAPAVSRDVDAPHPAMPAAAPRLAPAPPARSRRAIRGAYPAIGLVALVVAVVVALFVPINGRDTGSTAATSTSIAPAPRHDDPAVTDAETHATSGAVGEPAVERRLGDSRGDGSTVSPARAAGGGFENSSSASSRNAGPTGTLQVRTQPSGAQVWVDGMKAGRSPVTLNVATGEHKIEISSDGGSVTDVVTVPRDATTSVVIPLPVATRAERAEAAPRAETAAATGWIGITSPIDVEVFENDQLIGTKDSRRLMLPAGTHRLNIVNQDLGYASRRVVNVTPGKLTTVTVEVSPGTLAINAVPWADVWLDGQPLGPTPIGNVKASVGTHDVVFRHPKLGEHRRSVVVPLSGIARISVDMGAK